MPIAICRRIAGLGVVSAFSFGSTLFGLAEQGAGKRPFTVKDSIEISYIVNPAPSTKIRVTGEQPLGVPIYSPDTKYFLLVTQRGVLAANSLEGTIWLFDLKSVRDYAAGKAATKPVPTKLVTMNSTSNTPVVNDVRWIDGSKQIAFLGKNNSPYQQLFVANVETGAVRAVTKGDLYVTGYDIRGNTIAYASLIREQPHEDFESGLVAVGERNIWELLYRTPPALEDLEESLLSRLPSSLHIQKAGKEIPIDFKIDNRRLRMFVPTLSISPDAKFLITVAPVAEIPRAWEHYQPFDEQFRLKSGPSPEKSLMSYSFLRPEQYVIVDLETGSASPLIDAPAGRGLGYYDVPTEVFWLTNARTAVLTNTYLPLVDPRTEENVSQTRVTRPVVACVDMSTRAVQEVTGLQLPNSRETENLYGMDDVIWDEARQELTLRFKAVDDAPSVPPAPETYAFRAGVWVRLQASDHHPVDEPKGGVQLSVHQDLNHAPMLWAQFPGTKSASVLWDPNPQLEYLKLGKASIYHWQVDKERKGSGILVLPPDYDPNHRYPLVIQTHGYNAEKFFADGYSSTGTGGMALVAKSIIVLQTDMSVARLSTPDEGPDQNAQFEAAVNQLVKDGLVDRNLVGVIGFSRTCFHVLYAITHRPDLFRVASISDGVSFGYAEYVQRSSGNAYQKDAENIYQGAPYGDDLVKWIRSAPNFNLDKVRAPLLISALEKGVLLSDEWETYAGLRRLNKPVDLLWWWKENTPHFLVQPAQRYASQQLAVDWFDFWLNGGEDRDSRKTEQYLRWRKLRRLEAAN